MSDEKTHVLPYVDHGNEAAKVVCGDGWCNPNNTRAHFRAVGVRF